VRTRERGPPSASAEILVIFSFKNTDCPAVNDS
jgi:hypothetical protein